MFVGELPVQLLTAHVAAVAPFGSPVAHFVNPPGREVSSNPAVRNSSFASITHWPSLTVSLSPCHMVDVVMFVFTKVRSDSLPIVTRYPDTPPQVAFDELVWALEAVAADDWYR